MISLGFVLLVIVFYTKNKKANAEQINVETPKVAESEALDVADGSAASMEAGEMMNGGVAAVGVEVANELPEVAANPLEVGVDGVTPASVVGTPEVETPVTAADVVPEVGAVAGAVSSVDVSSPSVSGVNVASGEGVDEVASVADAPEVENPAVDSSPDLGVVGDSSVDSAPSLSDVVADVPSVESAVADAPAIGDVVSAPEDSAADLSAEAVVDPVAPVVAEGIADEFHDEVSSEVVVDPVAEVSVDSPVVGSVDAVSDTPPSEADIDDVEGAVGVTSASIPPSQ
jgi:hypothetical protein